MPGVRHLTLKKEATRPAALNFVRQQERFECCTEACNHQRPRQGLGGACPGDAYTPSARVDEPPPEPAYPCHDRSVRGTRCGRLCIGQRKINLSQVFAGQTAGIREVEDRIWLVSFLDFDLGFFDQEEGRVEPAPHPFVPEEVLTMSPGRTPQRWSGRRDSNPRLPAPKAGALPDCATPRHYPL